MPNEPQRSSREAGRSGPRALGPDASRGPAAGGAPFDPGGGGQDDAGGGRPHPRTRPRRPFHPARPDASRGGPPVISGRRGELGAGDGTALPFARGAVADRVRGRRAVCGAFLGGGADGTHAGRVPLDARRARIADGDAGGTPPHARRRGGGGLRVVGAACAPVSTATWAIDARDMRGEGG